MTKAKNSKQNIQPIAINHFSDDLAKAIFAGQLFCLKINNQQLIQDRELIKNTIQAAFKPYPAIKAHLYFGAEEFSKRVNALSDSITLNYQKTVLNLVNDFSVDSDLIYWDKLVLRVVAPIESKISGVKHQKINAHRDSWGVNLHSQINFWSPIFPLSTKRTIQFYPSYWHKPIENSTKNWSFNQYLKSKKTNPKSSYPSAPICLSAAKNPHPIVIEPNDWLIFSAAHLHSSAPNSSNLTRFSLEFRIINQNHLKQNLAAKNIDNHSKEPALTKIFSNLKTNQVLEPIS